MRSDILVLVLVVLGAGACNREKPGFTAPTAVDGTPVFTIVSGRPPHAPIPGAQVSIEGFGVFDADSRGVVLLPDIDNRQVLEISADGFLSSTPMLHQVQDGTYWLIPNDSEMPWHWLFEAWYKSDERSSLWRPEPGVVEVAASQEILEDTFLLNALEWGISTINRAQPHVSYVLSSGNAPIQVLRDPNDPYFSEPGTDAVWAVAYQYRSGGVVVGGRIVFKYFTRDALTRKHLHQTMAHELAHLTSLNGHAPGGLMTNWDINQDFSAQEKLAMFMAFLRPGGTRPPDNVAGSLVHSSGPTSPGLRTGEVKEYVVCVVQQ